MTISLRPARPEECAELSALCFRSKAYWGYDADFMEACRDELTIGAGDCTETLVVAELDGAPAGLAQVGPLGEDADILLLFVDPDAMGAGIGRQLFTWCADAARRMGARRLLIDADPGARPFYERMGAVLIGERPSASIPGRRLPHLSLAL